MIYYTETLHYNHDSLMNALSKGRDDYFEVLRLMGCKRIAIPSCRNKRFMSAAERLSVERRLTSEWKKALKQIKPGDTLIIHSPNSEKFIAFAGMIKKLHDRGVKIITITFELETFFIMDYRRFAHIKRFTSKRTESILFNNSDAIVVHNDVMKTKLGEAGFDTGIMFSVGIMDYLRDEPLLYSPSERIKKDKPVIYAGHLTREKSTFEYDLPKEFRCNLYGSDYTGDENDDVHYMGVFDPMSLMDIMEGSFGLVWEGDSCSGCYGTYGDYLTFNNPHKIALYIASGFPVIVWSGAAMADFVRKEKCGLIVDDLYCVPELLKNLSDEEYEELRFNACRVGNEMRRGVHIEQAVKAALEHIDQQETAINKKSGNKNAYILFTREPVAGRTKTRLMPYYTADQCSELHKCFLRDIAKEMKGGDFDLIVTYTGGEPAAIKEIFGKKARYIEQRGEDLGARMENAFSDVLKMGYERVVLTGSDIPELEADTIETALSMLGICDVALGPTTDGGYYLVGLKELHHEVFDAKTYGTATVFDETVSSIREAGLSVEIVDEYSDIDTREDLAALRSRIREDQMLRRSCTARFITKNQKVSIIIPTYNEEKTAAAMKEQMNRLVSGRDDAELIFVDGGSTDSTLKILGSDFKVLNSEKGRGVQMNTGALSSSGDVLFFLHCDSVLPADFIEEIKKCMIAHSFGSFGVRFSSRNLFMITNRIISNHRAFARGIPFGDQGIFIDRQLFFETGMFPEIPLMEDYELSLRLRRRGIRPGMTVKRILTSGRRYGAGTKSILKTEFKMWNLRRLYRKGRDVNELSDSYGDIR